MINNTIEVQVQDNGEGYPMSILSNDILKGNSIGKEGGQGLGLFHAKQEIEKYNGSFSLVNKAAIFRHIYKFRNIKILIAAHIGIFPATYNVVIFYFAKCTF